MWQDIDPYDWLTKFYKFYIAAVGSIISRCCEVCHRNQSNNTKPSAVKAITFTLRVVLKQLYISKKKECLSYKSGCGLCVSMAFKEELAT